MSVLEAIYLGLALLAVAGLWVVAKTGDPRRQERGSFGEKLQPRRPTERERLLEARARVKHQLGLRTLKGRVNDAAVREELGQILKEIDAELAQTPPDKITPRRGLKS